MKILNLLIIMALAALFALGCAEKKEEAAALEQEMIDAEQEADTAIATPFQADDSSATVEWTQEAEVEPEPEPVASDLPGGNFTVQVAGCESLEYAQHLIEVYTGRGYEPYLTETTVGDQVYYRVRIGGFESLADAEKLREELIDKYSIEPWVDNL